MGEPEVIDVLERAKAEQLKLANNTSVIIKLALLEELIAEIEGLRHRVEALSENHMKPVRERAQKRQEEAGHDRRETPLSRQQE